MTLISDCIGQYLETGIIHKGTFGIEIETETINKYNYPKFSFWEGKADPSLRNFGREYVLKVPLDYGEELNSALIEFDIKTKEIPFIQDSISTSVHVHVNMLPETWVTLGNFITIYILVENFFIDFSGEFRRNNLFCLPIRSVPLLINTLQKMFNSVKQKRFHLQNIVPVDHCKYASLNLSTLPRFGSVEIRSFRGSTDINLISQWVDLINDVLIFAQKDITPVDIISLYRDKDYSLFKDLFGRRIDLLKYPEELHLDEPVNLWYAGVFAHQFSNKQWKNLRHISIADPLIKEQYKNLIQENDVNVVEPPQNEINLNQIEQIENLLQQDDRGQGVINEFLPQNFERNVRNFWENMAIDNGEIE